MAAPLTRKNGKLRRKIRGLSFLRFRGDLEVNVFCDVLVARHIYENYLRLFMQPEFIKPFKIISVMFLVSYFLSLRPAKFYLVNILSILGVKADKMKIMVRKYHI